MADPGLGKGCLCTVATTPLFDAHAHRCNESSCCCFNSLELPDPVWPRETTVLTASNCRETVNLFAGSKGVSMETVETPLDPPLSMGHQLKLGYVVAIQT